MENVSNKGDSNIRSLSRTSVKSTNLLLAFGVAAGPIYIITGLIQVLTRSGFDIRRHALSLLSYGELGWIQIANFMVSGLLVLGFAAGLRGAMHVGRSHTWGSLLIGVYGIALIGAGLFVADPALGFPIGTPEGPSSSPSWHGLLHFVSGGVGFLSLIAACFVFARGFAVRRQHGWAAFSVITGVYFFAAFVGISSGSGNVTVNIAFTSAVILGWTWLSLSNSP
jgi:hypothetical protein